jgi:hypothetical protein
MLAQAVRFDSRLTCEPGITMANQASIRPIVTAPSPTSAQSDGADACDSRLEGVGMKLRCCERALERRNVGSRAAVGCWMAGW